MEPYRSFEQICERGATAGFTTGLCGEWTKERFERLAALFEKKADRLIVADQKHTGKVLFVDDKDAGKGICRPYDGAPFDAMITDTPGLMLCVHTADCVPIAMLDPVRKAIGIVHSGWAGSSKRIAGKTVRNMAESFGSDPKDILCCIGPYNHVCCYEVGEDVREAFLSSFSKSECEDFFSKKETEGKYMLDMGKAIRLSLQQEGIRTENIFDTDRCTCHTTDLPSYRRTGDKKEQILSFIMLPV
ncbi:MAG: peptidoglycan editing factor PgeF [Lachnospiraceae bacterium]|nr:peptidoglycan editing factor PgeF [Lachnospiraceae bacterium]